MAHCVLPAAEFNEAGAVHARGRGTHTGGAPRYNVYAARDGRYLAVGAQEKKFWDALCDALELPGLKDKHQPELMEAAAVSARLAQAFARHDAADWLATLEPLDCCVSAVLTCEEALADPGFVARGTVHNAGNGAPVTLGLPLVMSGHSCPVERPSPERGQHTVAILERLGYRAAEVDGLRARGII